MAYLKMVELPTRLCEVKGELGYFHRPDEETLRNMRASGLISHNDYRTRLGLSPMKD